MIIGMCSVRACPRVARCCGLPNRSTRGGAEPTIHRGLRSRARKMSDGEMWTVPQGRGVLGTM